MLDNIKNKYLLGFIFENIRKRLKLKLLKYNKNLMNKLNINIDNFKQFKLLKEINQELNLNIEDIELVSLDLNYKNLNDDKLKTLDKIEFINLKKLYLNNNKITRFKTFDKYSLEILDLGNNKISDISILKNDIFKELKELYLNNNKITELKDLTNVKFNKLEILDLSEN